MNTSNQAAYEAQRRAIAAFKSSPDLATLDFVIGAYVRYRDAEDTLKSAQSAHADGVLFAERGVEVSKVNLTNARRDMAEALFRMSNINPANTLFFAGISVLIEPLNERAQLNEDDLALTNDDIPGLGTPSA